MPEVRLLVPMEGHQVDDVIDVDVETAEAWRAMGKVSLITTEQALMEQAGHYSDVTGRDDVAGPSAGTRLPGPQAEEDDKDDDKPRSKGKK